MTARTTFLRALFVDLDGTLVDSLPALKGAYRDFVEAHGGAPSDEEFNRWNGPALPAIVTGLAESHRLKGVHDDLLADYERRMAAAYERDARLMPGAVELLQWARRESLHVAVVTACRTDLAGAVLSRLGLAEGVAAVLGGDSVATGKPAPDLYLSALKRIGVSPEYVVAIEDSPSGIRAACAANLRCLGVACERPTAELLRAGAFASVNSLVEAGPKIARAFASQPLAVVGARALDVSLAETPFAPAPAVVERVQTFWNALAQVRPTLHDGTVVALTGYEKQADSLAVVIHAVPYRYCLAQRRGLDPKVMGVAVAGVAFGQEAGRRTFVLGRRSQSVVQHPRCWEFVPSGALSWSSVKGKTVDAAGHLREELGEELGVEYAEGARLFPIGLIEDWDAAVVELCFGVEIAGPVVRPAANPEYEDFQLVQEQELPNFLREHGAWVAPNVEPMYRLLKQHDR